MQVAEKTTFEQDVDRDARLVLAGLQGGFQAVCAVAMMNPLFSDGPDAVLAHADWLKKQDPSYVTSVAVRASQIEAGIE